MAELPDENPYVGPRPFERGDERSFYGRDREARELLSLVLAHRVVLFYAASGAGKTSLLNAGLAPLLEEEEEVELLPPARLRGLHADDALPSDAPNVYVFNLLANWKKDLGGRSVEASQPATEPSLARFLRAREHALAADGLPTARALVIDQFEELFSVYPGRWRERTGFFEQLAEALAHDPLLRVVLAIREDYLAQLDPYVSLLPGGLRARLRLERLGPEAALSAVTGPLEGTGRSFAPGVAEKLVDDLLKIRVDVGRPELVEVGGEVVEPVQLQVACSSLWSELPPDVAEITEEHLRTFGDVDQVLSRFYAEAIGAAAARVQIDEEKLRDAFEQQFVTSMGTRGTVYRTTESTGVIPNDAIDELDGRHLIRAELRSGIRWYELTHDRLIGPIRASNREHSARIQARRRRRVRVLVAAAFVVLLAGSLLFGLLRFQAGEAEAESQLRESVNTIMRGHTGPVLSAAFSTDGKSVVTAGADGTARLWKAATGEQIATLRGNTGRVLVAAFNPLGEVVTVASDGRVRLWDAETGASLGAAGGHGPVERAAFSPDASRVVTVSANGDLAVWDTATAEVIPEAVPRGGPFVGAAVGPGDALAVTSAFDATTLIRGGDRRTFRGHDDAVNGVAFSPDGRLVATASDDGTVRLWQAATGRSVAVLRGHQRSVRSVAFSPDGRRVATAGDDGTARLWDAATAVSVAVVRGHAGPVLSVAYSPDGKFVVSSSEDATARVFGVPTDSRPQAPAAAVRDLQRDLKTLGFYAGLIDGRDSAATEKAVVAFQAEHGLTVDGIAGPVTLAAISKALSERDPEAVRKRIVDAALEGVTKREQIHYTFDARRMEGVRKRIRLPRVPRFEDTSSFATWCYFQAEAPDPNGRNYDGFGFTGTMVREGRETDSPELGDLVFYGPARKPVHVAIYVGVGRVVSHGQEAGPLLVPIDYRPDRLQIRTYLP